MHEKCLQSVYTSVGEATIQQVVPGYLSKSSPLVPCVVICGAEWCKPGFPQIDNTVYSVLYRHHLLTALEEFLFLSLSLTHTHTHTLTIILHYLVKKE